MRKIKLLHFFYCFRYYNDNRDVKEDEEFGNFLNELAVDVSIEPPYGDYSSGDVSLQSCTISSVVRLVTAIVITKCL